MFGRIRHPVSSPRQERERGQGLVEYALILVLVAIVAIVVLLLIGTGVKETLGDIACTLRYGGSTSYGNTLDSAVQGSVILDPDDPTEPTCWLWDGSSYQDVGAPSA